MAINSIDQVYASISAGKSAKTYFNKQTGASAYTAGRHYDLSSLTGSPVANAWAGTALTYTPCNESTGNGTQIFGMRHGGNVSTDIKHLMNMNGLTNVATGVPSSLILVDICGYWPGINMNVNTLQTLSGTPSLRYTNGQGVLPYLVITTASGATAHNLTLSYTDQDGNTGNSLGATVACTASAIAGHITHSGTAANNYGPFLPLAGGDFGVRNVASVQLSAASGAGTAALVLARPIAEFPLTTVNLATERDMLNQFPSFPTIPDGACLSWILFAGAAVAANTNFFGNIETVWG